MGNCETTTLSCSRTSELPKRLSGHSAVLSAPAVCPVTSSRRSMRSNATHTRCQMPIGAGGLEADRSRSFRQNHGCLPTETITTEETNDDTEESAPVEVPHRPEGRN